jgi:hypothetical protein
LKEIFWLLSLGNCKKLEALGTPPSRKVTSHFGTERLEMRLANMLAIFEHCWTDNICLGGLRQILRHSMRCY